jgi:hypothetical protein
VTGTADVEALRERVDRFLSETPLQFSVDDAGDFMIPYGATVTWLRPIPWKEGRTLLRVWSISNVDMRCDAELTHFLVSTNARLAFGGLHLDEQRPSVILAQSLLGEYLNRAELQVAVAAVAGGADRFGPEIKRRFGGLLFTEA